MSRKRNVPALLASTTMMILRNRLSERVWGSRGVYSPHLGGVKPRHGSNPPVRSPSRLGGVPLRPSLSVSRSSILDGVGVIGDSISDEYRFFVPDRASARNWVEILTAIRDFSFGGPTLGAQGGDHGLAHNWSQSGATTASLIAFGQESRLVERIKDGSPINLAAVAIGTNDFADVLFTSRSLASMEIALEHASANLAVILNSLLGATPTLRIAVFTAVDLRSSPLIRGIIGSGLLAKPLTEAYSAAIAEYNRRIGQFISAHSQRAVLVDINELLESIVESPRYSVADWELIRNVPSNDPRHLFLADGFHPGTIGQCLIANRFLDAVNRRFGAGIPRLEDEEMVRFAASIPKPSGFSLIGTGVLALLGRGVRPHRAA